MQDAAKYYLTQLITDEKKLCNAISSPLFHGLSTLGGGVYEVTSKPKRVVVKDCLQIAFFVYAAAKIVMLSFVYDFLDYYFERTSYEICSTDTDSLYLAWAKTETGNYEDLVKPELRRTYFENRSQFLPTEVCQNPSCREYYVDAKTNKTTWIQPECCNKAERFDQRTPGLFKTEYVGDEICFLNPKTYCCEGEKNKLSCKGVIRKLNPLKMEDFTKVLYGEERDGVTYNVKHNVTNKGFRFVDGKMRTYSQLKCGLNPIFIKRKVLPDKIHTEPLDL